MKSSIQGLVSKEAIDGPFQIYLKVEEGKGFHKNEGSYNKMFIYRLEK